jgi:hypothetical protein
MTHSGHHGGGEAAASGDDDKASSSRWQQKLALNDRQARMRVYILAAAQGPSAFQQFGARFKDNRAWQFVNIACGQTLWWTARRNLPLRSSPPLSLRQLDPEPRLVKTLARCSGSFGTCLPDRAPP